MRTTQWWVFFGIEINKFKKNPACRAYMYIQSRGWLRLNCMQHGIGNVMTILSLSVAAQNPWRPLKEELEKYHFRNTRKYTSKYPGTTLAWTINSHLWSQRSSILCPQEMRLCNSTNCNITNYYLATLLVTVLDVNRRVRRTKTWPHIRHLTEDNTLFIFPNPPRAPSS